MIYETESEAAGKKWPKREKEMFRYRGISRSDEGYRVW